MHYYKYYYVAHLISYWVSAFILDKKGTIQCLRDGTSRTVFLNQFIINALVALPMALAPTINQGLPFPAQLVAAALITDILFYCAHRLFHGKFLYRTFHFVHHAQEASAALSLCAHPVEHFFANAMPVTVAGLLTGMNTYAFTLWIIIATTNNVLGHMPSRAKLHIIHHKKLNKNFGVAFFVADRICGTFSTNGPK